MPTADGQSIAIRLAKRISSSTDSLKRALIKFNSMAPDMLEGTAYHLPEKHNWELVSNVERLISLEVNSIISQTTVPTELSAKIVRIYDMKRRAEEEVEMLQEEMSRVVDFYTSEHSLLEQHIDSLMSMVSLSHFQRGCLNLLHHRLLSCEVSLTNFVHSVRYHHGIHLDLPQLRMIVADSYGSFIEDESEELPIDYEMVQSDYSDSEDEC